MYLVRTEPCPDCKGTKFTEWRSEGDLTCMQCGLVVEQHMIDERSEWRTFSDKDKDTSDPNRVGGPNNPLLQGLTTTIARERGDKGVSFQLNRVHARANNVDKVLTDAFKQVAVLCEQLGVVGAAKDLACKVYKEVVFDKQALKGRSTRAICAACVFIGCRKAGVTRTFKDIQIALGSDASKKDIGKCFKELTNLMKEDAEMAGEASDAAKDQMVQTPGVLVRKYGNMLQLHFKVVKAAEDIAAEAVQGYYVWQGRTPFTIAAAILFVAMSLAENRKEAGGSAEAEQKDSKAKRTASDTLLNQVKLVSNVAEGTIRGMYREMCADLPKFVPKSVASEDELKRLPVLHAIKDTAGPSSAVKAEQGVKAEPGVQAEAGIKPEPVI